MNDIKIIKILLVVPARKGSSFKDKNRRILDGIPLFYHTFKQLKPFTNTRLSFGKNISITTSTLITTDDHYIKADAILQGFDLHNRPRHLAGDKTTLNHLMHVMAREYPQYDYYACLPPTSPFRTTKHIEESIIKLIETNADSIVSVTAEYKSIWKPPTGIYTQPVVVTKKGRQDIDPHFISNGAITITAKHILKRYKMRTGGRTVMYEMPHLSSIDIHNDYDMKLAQFHRDNKLC